MDAFCTLDIITEAAPTFDTPHPAIAFRAPEHCDDFMRMVANSDSADGYFGGYCVVA
ncbi:mating pheromone precursor bbp2-4 [Schizophyllum fasciatum]